MKIKNANKWKYKPQRMGRGEEAGVERNFSTAINRGECRAHGLLLVTRTTHDPRGGFCNYNCFLPCTQYHSAIKTQGIKEKT